MCGIAGILHFNSLEEAAAKTQLMTHALVHRGPDAAGYFNDHNISLGHRRLSIIDLSQAANQPFEDPSGRYVLVFNGEIYNHKVLRGELGNWNFQTQSDTEVLLAAFATWGIACLKRLKGMFAFAIWDRIEEKCWLVRDRLGVKPLLYFKGKDFLAFASERRSLLASGLIDPKIDPQAMFEMLSYQSTGYPNTIVNGILQLKAGTFLCIDRHGNANTTYWDFSSIEPRDDVSASEARKSVFSLLMDSVSNRMVADVPMAAFLSGGIDSSTIVALMSLQQQGPVNTFNLAFTEKEYDESMYAAKIAHRFTTQHQSVVLHPDDYLSQVQTALDEMDSPSMDGVNTYVLSAAIRHAGMKVALSGIGGDELFAGYPNFMNFHRLRKQKQGYYFLYLARKIAAKFYANKGTNRDQRLASLLNMKSPSIDKVYPILRQVLTPQFIRRFAAMDGFESNLGSILQQTKMGMETLGDISQYSIAEYLGYTQNTLLKDADQMSMSVGLEIREPFFDHELIEYVLSLPDALKMPTSPKKLLVEAMDPLLPDEIVHRPKQGFLLPWEHWMRNELSGFCASRINMIADHPLIHEKELKAYWQRFMKKDPDVKWPELWLFVVLGHWMDKNGVS